MAHETTGENYVWYMDGVTVIGGGSLPAVADQDWKAVGVADFNNDDKPDILWRNASTGDNYVWYMDGVTVVGGGNLPAIADQNWKIVGVDGLQRRRMGGYPLAEQPRRRRIMCGI